MQKMKIVKVKMSICENEQNAGDKDRERDWNEKYGACESEGNEGGEACERNWNEEYGVCESEGNQGDHGHAGGASEWLEEENEECASERHGEENEEYKSERHGDENEECKSDWNEGDQGGSSNYLYSERRGHLCGN